MNWKEYFETFFLPELRFFSVYQDNGDIAGVQTPGMKLHQHDYREVLFVAGGKSDFILGSRCLHLVPGDVVLIDARVPHSFEYTSGDHDLQHLWFFFKDEQLRMTLYSVLPHGRYAYLHCPHVLPQHIFTLFSTRWNEFAKTRNKDQKNGKFYFETPFKCMFEEFQMHFSNPRREQKEGAADLINAVKLYIESQNARNCSLAELENIFGYNRYYLAHCFKQECGMSPGKYINRVRLTFTENALARGAKQKEIAMELGFSSPAAFWKWLRKNTGK